MAKTLQGKFRPRNPEKYKGNAGGIIYRSSWELNFCKWCDQNKNVIWWQSEEKRIPYFDPVRMKTRTYFPDFYLAIKGEDGTIREELVEIKPQRQVDGPSKTPKRKTQSWVNEVYTYATNTAKWEAANEWCEDRGINFRLLTEKNIKEWK